MSAAMALMLGQPSLYSFLFSLNIFFLLWPRLICLYGHNEKDKREKKGEPVIGAHTIDL